MRWFRCLLGQLHLWLEILDLIIEKESGSQWPEMIPSRYPTALPERAWPGYRYPQKMINPKLKKWHTALVLPQAGRVLEAQLHAGARHAWAFTLIDH